MNKKRSLISGILRGQINLEMMVPQRAKEAPKTSGAIPVSLLVVILEEQNNTEAIGSMDITVQLKKMVINQRQIPGQS